MKNGKILIATPFFNMKKEKIRFSHHYNKMPSRDVIENGKHIVMAVHAEDIKNLNENFLEYDTRYYSHITKEREYYPLEFKRGILIFIFSYRIHCVNCELETKMWTTIRRETPQKLKWYKSLVGKEVEIVIENNNKR